jgi:hypothetical protein
MTRWREVTAKSPCPACGGVDWCAWTPDDATLKCERSPVSPPGMTLIRAKDGGGLFRSTEAGANRAVRSGRSRVLQLDWEAESERYIAAMRPAQLLELASRLGVRPESLSVLEVGWASREDLLRMRAGGAGWPEQYPDGAFTFPERDGAGRICGFSLRAKDGRKGAPGRKVGGRRGLIIPNTFSQREDPVLVVEGASDVAACECLGLAAVGRPSNAGGSEHLIRLLEGREVLVVGERDTKPTGAWPGRDGAKQVSRRMATEWNSPVTWTLPPATAKDLRAWLTDRVTAGLGLSDANARGAAGLELLKELRAIAEEEKPAARPSQSELLVRLALECYRLGLNEAGEPFAVKRDGPNAALMFRGSRDALRSVLAREYRRRYATTPNASALADALTVLQGEAHDCSPEPVHLRLARHQDGIILDLGDAEGTAVFVRPGRWDVLEKSPVLFRRTALTGELPEPQRGGDPAQLRELLNVSDETWPLVLGWLAAAFIPDIPHAILMLGGIQGTGKSTVARMLVGIFDPSPAMLRSPPKEPEQWAIAAAGSWGIVIDNVSTVPVWWSDALCKAVTGDGWIRRKLYTDGELAVLSFRRVVALTSIDPGALRGDLGDRLPLVELDEIDESKRQDETRLERLYTDRRPMILGALLDVLSRVLEKLPDVDLPARPRMSDFARVQAAVDEVVGSDGLSRYLSQRDRIARDVLDGDAVAVAMIALMESLPTWRGSPTELYERITPKTPSRNWPKNASCLSGQLKRLAPALKTVGLRVVHDRESSAGRRRFILIERVEKNAVRGVQPSNDSDSEDAEWDSAWSVPDGVRTATDGNVVGAPSGGNGSDDPEEAMVPVRSDGPDGSDGNSRRSSKREVLEL